MFRKIALFAFLACSICLTHWGCSSSLKPCKTSRDCSELFTCRNQLCQQPCKRDSDCSGKTCAGDGFCGGLQKPDGDTGDAGAGECTPGTSKSCYSGADGTAGVGLCKEGVQRCGSDEKWGACEGEVAPAKEDCGDGKDNDCNGQVDDGCGNQTCVVGQRRPCYTAAKNTQDVGPCKAGAQTCEKLGEDGTQWGQCDGQVLPIPELCTNEIDDDCDGTVNEECACKPGQIRKCKASTGCAGQETCQPAPGGQGTKWSECTASQPSDEECDGFDNDCDGKVDNVKGGSDPLTRECNNVCFKGTETCEGGSYKNCTAELPAQAESPDLCNNKDDDCDGKIDNIKDKDDPLLKGCKHPTAKGVCATGATQTCDKGKWSECKAGNPINENCNGIDDDCDGEVDEDADKPCGDGATCKEVKDDKGQSSYICAQG